MYMYIYRFMCIHKSTRPSPARQQLCQPSPPRVRADIGGGGAGPETSAALPAPGGGGVERHFATRSRPTLRRGAADGHTVSNAPDLFRPPKLSGTGPG